MPIHFSLILTAAGSSSRFNKDSDEKRKKEYLEIDGESILSRSLKPFLSFKELECVVVTYKKGGKEEAEKALEKTSISCPLYLVEGGNNRTQSVKNAVLFLSTLTLNSTLIAIHDGARPFIKEETILSVLKEAKIFGAAAPAIKVTDALKGIDSSSYITSDIDRDYVVRLQTPQIFSKERLISIYRKVEKDESYKDDTELYIKSGEKCKIVEGDENNIKITYSSDIKREKKMRIGFGNDIHALKEGRKLVLGGVTLPYSKGEAAHSDGDVLIHALIDSILGALALSDIGHFFPPEDGKWKDADSKELLSHILSLTKPIIINIDSVITLDSFKLSPYIEEIKKSLSLLLSLPLSAISIKAKTNEGLDSIGKGDAIKAEVVILLEN